MIVELSYIRSSDTDSVGRTAARLGERLRNGVEVAPGFVVTTDDLAELAEREQLPARLEGASPDGAAAIAAEVIGTAELPADLVDDLAESIAALGRDAWVTVQASPAERDLGVSREVLGPVQGADATWELVRRVWASLWTPEAVARREEKGVADAQDGLAVLVQRAETPAEPAGKTPAEPAEAERPAQEELPVEEPEEASVEEAHEADQAEEVVAEAERIEDEARVVESAEIIAEETGPAEAAEVIVEEAETEEAAKTPAGGAAGAEATADEAEPTETETGKAPAEETVEAEIVEEGDGEPPADGIPEEAAEAAGTEPGAGPEATVRDSTTRDSTAAGAGAAREDTAAAPRRRSPAIGRGLLIGALVVLVLLLVGRRRR